MTISILRALATVGAVLVTTAAMCNKDSGASAAPAGDTSVAAPAVSAGPGLPSDFPLAPGLSACAPIVTGPEVICDWHNVDGHAIYTFYHDALPKAGYTLNAGQETLTPHYRGLLYFTKGKVKGAATILNTDLTIQTFTGQ